MDRATERLRKLSALRANESRIRLLQQQNHGKARALQRGLAAARNGIVVFIDADTQCQRDTLPRLLEPFADERIGAVSGHAKVGNLRTFIARCQALEYTCGFNLDRRAYNRWQLHHCCAGRDQRHSQGCDQRSRRSQSGNARRRYRSDSLVCTGTVSASCMCPTRSRGQKRPRPCAR